MKPNDLLFYAGMGIVAICLGITLLTPPGQSDSDIAGATICAMKEHGLTSDWQSVRYHAEGGAVYIDGVTWEPSPTGEYIGSPNTHTVKCGSVAR